MREICPGLFHWTTFHDGIGYPVSSYYVEPAGALIDPRIPDEGMDAFAKLKQPRQIVLTTGLHARHSVLFAETFGCVIRVSPEALERISAGLEADLYTDGEEVAPGITAIHIDAIAPDEYALHVALDGGAIVLADALHRYDGELGFFSDALLGDDPEAVKAGLRDAVEELLTWEFEHLLLAHGDPLIGDGKAALSEFLGEGSA